MVVRFLRVSIVRRAEGIFLKKQVVLEERTLVLFILCVWSVWRKIALYPHIRTRLFVIVAMREEKLTLIVKEIRMKMQL